MSNTLCGASVTHRDEDHRQSVCVLPVTHRTPHDDGDGCTWTDSEHWQQDDAVMARLIVRLADEIPVREKAEARVARVDAVLRLIEPDDITPLGARRIREALKADATEPAGGGEPAVSGHPAKCDTTLMGRIFGHKWFYRMRSAGLTQATDHCVRCGWGPTS